MAPAAALATAEMAGGAASAVDMGLARFISSLDLCLLQPGDPSTPANLSIPLIGELRVWSLCCQNLSLAGLDVQADAAPGPEPWSGAADISIGVAQLAASCRATYTFDRVPGEEGSMVLGLGTVAGAAGDRFADVAVRLSGAPLLDGEARQYPWPGAVEAATCVAGFQISGLVFTGPGSGLLNLLGDAAELLQGLLRGLLCDLVDAELRPALDGALTRFRNVAEPLARTLQPDLDMPSKPAGSGPSCDLTASKPVAFAQRLLLEGFRTGDMQRLVDRATHDTGKFSFKFPHGGFRFLNVSLRRPARVAIAAAVEAGGAEDVNTIDNVKLDAEDSGSLSLTFEQSRLHVWTDLRIASDELLLDSSAGRALRSIAAALLERLRLRFALSGMHIDGRFGLLLDRNRMDELTRGMSWYDTACMGSMVQNASILGADVRVTVDEITCVLPAGTRDDLEADLVRSFDDVLAFLTSPLMRPTISRLLLTGAAGPLRDAVNSGIQAALLRPAAEPCLLDMGSGSVAACYAGCAAAATACFIPVAWLLRRRCCKAQSRSIAVATVRAAPRDASAEGRASEPAPSLAPIARSASDADGAVPPSLRCAGGLALAALCFAGGGICGVPFRAAVRLWIGGGAADTLAYLYIASITDLLTYTPWTVLAMAISGTFFAVRASALVALALLGPSPRILRLVRLTTAAGAWGLGLMFLTAGTQITGFYARILQFGDTFTDMGAQVTVSYYAYILGCYVCDLAAVVALHGRLAADSPPNGCAVAAAAEPSATARPRLLQLAGLVTCAAAFLMLPWLILWRFNYTGAVERVVQFQLNSGDSRQVSLASLAAHCPDMLLNPHELGFGAYFVVLPLLLHIVIAPMSHTLLALYVGLRLRRVRGAASPPGSAAFSAASSSSSSSSSSVALGGDGGAGGVALLDEAPGEVGPMEPAGENGAEAAPDKASGESVIVYALAVTRMWSGADAFAAYMFVCVPELGTQLVMMTRQICGLVEPVLGVLDEPCMNLSSSFGPGAFVALAAGLAARLLAEPVAHAPVRRAASAGGRRGLWPWGQKVAVLAPASRDAAGGPGEPDAAAAA